MAFDHGVVEGPGKAIELAANPFLASVPDGSAPAPAPLRHVLLLPRSRRSDPAAGSPFCDVAFQGK